ncbi:MAG TPA: hypothetical protein VG096_06040 [Bryobacteraceae bacterium]|jgi:hypothetical protein|nr:hypothetical protein [Bryobacteraceae bacterium]
MLIEYKIRFEKNGLTIAQHIEPDSMRAAKQAQQNGNVSVNGLPATRTEVTSPAATNPLSTLSAKDVAAGPGDETTGPGDETTGPGDETTGGVGRGSAPIFIIGPIVFADSFHNEHERSTEPTVPDYQPKAQRAAAD